MSSLKCQPNLFPKFEPTKTQSFIITNNAIQISAYTTSAFYSGVMLAYNRTGSAKYLDFVKYQMDMILYPDWDGSIVLYNNSQSIDDIRIGHSFLDMYEATGSEIYYKAAKVLKQQIDRSHRTPQGGVYHRYPTYADQYVFWFFLVSSFISVGNSVPGESEDWDISMMLIWAGIGCG